MHSYFNTLRRIARHRWLAFRDVATRAITADMRKRLEQRIAASESLHSGQIRIYVESALPLGYLWRGASARERAITQFGKLRVWDTESNNGVLIYLLMAEHAIEIVADRGLCRAVPPQDWRKMVEHLGQSLASGHWEEGLVQALDETSAALVSHFPLPAGTVRQNEQPDTPMVR